MCAFFSLTRRFSVSSHELLKGKRGKALALFSELDREKFRKRQTHLYKKNTKTLTNQPTNQNQPSKKKSKKPKPKDYRKLKQMSWKVGHYIPDRGFWDEPKPQLYSGISSHLVLSCPLLPLPFTHSGTPSWASSSQLQPSKAV